MLPILETIAILNERRRKENEDAQIPCPFCKKVSHGDLWKNVGRSLTGSDEDRFMCPKCEAISDWECAG